MLKIFYQGLSHRAPSYDLWLHLSYQSPFVRLVQQWTFREREKHYLPQNRDMSTDGGLKVCIHIVWLLLSGCPGISFPQQTNFWGWLYWVWLRCSLPCPAGKESARPAWRAPGVQLRSTHQNGICKIDKATAEITVTPSQMIEHQSFRKCSQKE